MFAQSVCRKLTNFIDQKYQVIYGQLYDKLNINSKNEAISAKDECLWNYIRNGDKKDMLTNIIIIIILELVTLEELLATIKQHDFNYYSRYIESE